MGSSRELDPLSDNLIKAAIEVHRHLGPGLLESAYEECLCHELACAGMSFKRQVEIPMEYKGIKLNCGFRIDLEVEDKLLIELKSVEQILPIHKAQLLTYLKLRDYRRGPILNFNVELLRDGIKRVANKY